MGNTEGASTDRLREIYLVCLEKGLGVLPDLDGGEDWLSFDSIGFVIGRDSKTISNESTGLERPRQGYIRLSDYLRKTKPK